MNAGELLEAQLERPFSDTLQPGSGAAPERSHAPAADAALPSRWGITINIPLAFTRGGPPQGELRARLRRARRRLARLAAATRTEKRATAQRAAKMRAELERKARERADRRAADEMRRERQRMLGHLLVVADNLERALAHAQEDDPLSKGVRLTLVALCSANRARRISLFRRLLLRVHHTLARVTEQALAI